jgi:hypothetical protein
MIERTNHRQRVPGHRNGQIVTVIVDDTEG